MLATVLREADTPLKGVFIHGLVVLVSTDEPQLEGDCAASTVLLGDLVERVLRDPRPYAKKVPDDAAERAAAVLMRTATPIRPPDVVGNWKLDELLEATQTYELWTAKPLFGGSNARPMRLKRYLLDPLLTGELRQAQIGWRRG